MLCHSLEFLGEVGCDPAVRACCRDRLGNLLPEVDQVGAFPLALSEILLQFRKPLALPDDILVMLADAGCTRLAFFLRLEFLRCSRMFGFGAANVLVSTQRLERSQQAAPSGVFLYLP